MNIKRKRMKKANQKIKQQKILSRNKKGQVCRSCENHVPNHFLTIVRFRYAIQQTHTHSTSDSKNNSNTQPSLQCNVMHQHTTITETASDRRRRMPSHKGRTLNVTACLARVRLGSAWRQQQ